jgi:two-component system cell cycle response regulator DivK
MKRHILVVEDNPLNSELLRDWLEMEGYEAVIASTLKAGFAALESKPDAVLLDIQLGAEDGLTLASWMREQPGLRQVPIIAVTAQAMVSEQERIVNSGCKCIVSKPVDFKVLRQELDIWLGQVGAETGERVPSRE